MGRKGKKDKKRQVRKKMMQRTYFYSCSSKKYMKHIKGKLKRER